MSSRLLLGAYWPARKEPIDQCADRMHRFFRELAKCDPAFATWYKLGRSRTLALEKRVDVENRNDFLRLLDKGRHRNIERAVMEDLGFSTGLWNGGDEGKEAGLSITCGLYWVSPSPNASLSNSVTLELPEDLGELKQAGRMASLLALVARAWEPEWAGVMSNEAMESRNWKHKPFVDWMVYVPRRIDSVPLPSSVVRVESGSLIVVQPDPPAANDAVAEQNICRIETLLRQ